MEAVAAERAACSRCGTFYRNQRDVFYTDAGDKVCQKCFELNDLEVSAQRYAKRVRNGAYGAPLLALGAMVTSGLLGIVGLLLLGAVAVSAGGVLVAIARDDKLRGHLGGHLVPVCLCAALGLLMSGGCLLMVVLGLGAAFVMKR